MPFGRYKDRLIEDCPPDYLGWLLQSDLKLSRGLRQAIEEALNGKCCGCVAGPSWYARQQAEKLMGEGKEECRFFQPCDAPEYKFEPVRADVSAAEKRAPPSSWSWLGLVRLDDNKWRAVASAPTLEKCWDSLLHFPAQGDLLCLPSRPVSKEVVDAAT